MCRELKNRERMREEWIDRWKGLLISLVVLGHAVGVAAHFAHGMTREMFVFLYKAIYCFHMPAFFCVTGYVWRRKDGEGLQAFCWKKFKRLIVPYLIFATISAVIYYFTSGAFGTAVHNATDVYYAKKGTMPTALGLFLSIVHAGGWPNSGVFRANSVLWFLPVMFALCVSYRCIDEWIPNVRVQIFLAVVSLVGGHYIPRNLPWGISLLPYYLPFLVVGRLCGPKLMASAQGGIGQVVVIGILYFVLCWITPNAYLKTQHLSWRVCFALLALLGVYFSAIVAREVKVRFLLSLGVSSLGIMLMHKYVILALGMKVPIIRSYYDGHMFMAMIVVVGVSSAALLLSYGMTGLVERYCPEALGGRHK